MADWTKPFTSGWRWMRVSRSTGYEVGTVGNIAGGTLTVNADTATFESATASCIGPLDVGNDLVRCYLDAEWEDGTTESVCLGTWLPSIPSRDVRGSYESAGVRLDGRLKELDEDYFDGPVTLPPGTDPVGYAATVCSGAGLGVDADDYPGTLSTQWAFGLDDEGCSKLSAVDDLLGIAGFRAASTDAYGNVVMREESPIGARVAWDFREGPTATFLGDATDERDTTGVANKVIAVYECDGSTTIGTAVDNDPGSPWSTVSLGRTRAKVYRYNDAATQAQADAKAAELLANQQSVVRRVTVRHVWCGLRVGDDATVHYPSAGIDGAFRVRTQTIELGSAGCMTTSELRRFERA